MVLDNIIIAFIAFFIDKKYGEFPITHPIILIGKVISFLEKKIYKDSVLAGFFLVFLSLTIIGFFAFIVQYLVFLFPHWIAIGFIGIISSMFVAYHMLRKEVAKVIDAPTLEAKREQISMLVSRDTKDLDESDIYKAAIETYAENLSDGVIAPLLYLSCFGFIGIVLYKTINTLDSMVGYKNKRYIHFGKVAARLDDIVNYIPARITAILIMIQSNQKQLFAFYHDGKKHSSPNAGLPITAMALALDLKLGGSTSYFGKVVQKPYFGKGRDKITKKDLQKALELL